MTLWGTQEAQQEYGIHLVDWQDLSNLDAVVLSHRLPGYAPKAAGL